MKLKTRKYLAESFEAFKNSKKDDPFEKDEELENEEEQEAEAEAEEAEEVETEEEEAEEAEEENEEEEEEEEAEEEAEDAALNAELAEEDDEEQEDETDVEVSLGKPKNGVEVTATFGLSSDASSMMGGMNGLTSFKRPEWAITRVMTDNGERVAMEYQNETECEVIVGNLTYTEADARSTEVAQQLNLSVFNSETDKYLGKVSSKVVRKDDSQKKTSYKY